MKSKKIAIIGGSFDPIHKGHIAMGEYVLENLDIDEVLYIPTAQNPLKASITTSYEHRCNMISLVLKPKMRLYQASFQYTIDLIAHLKQRYHYEKIYFVIGNDQIETLHQWKAIDTLVSIVDFVVLNRNHQQTPCNYPLLRLPFKNHFESSTAVRNGDFRQIESSVANYILKHRLYIYSMLQNEMDEKRYLHTLSVAKTAVKLALNFGMEEILNQIELAALFHDYCKCWSKEKMLPIMKTHFKEYLHFPYQVWHGFVASVYLKEMQIIEDEMILTAIQNHTMMMHIHPFNLLLKVADYVEPLRKNVPHFIATMSFIHLDKTYLMIQERHQKEKLC